MRSMRSSRSADATRSPSFDGLKRGSLVKDLLLFDGCEDLCRAVPLREVLTGAGRVLRGSGGSGADYGRSRVVDQIKAFLSHNWSTPRFQKWWALVFHFHLKGVFIFTLAVAVGIAVLQVEGLLPSVHDRAWDAQVGFACRLVFAPLFLLCLWARADIQAWLGFPGIEVFLDKLCINQTDTEVMQKGIKKLGAFIASSQKMVVVYTDTYFKKLWTVYEVAAFLSLHSVDNLVVIPVPLSGLFLKGCACAALIPASTMLLRLVSDLPVGIVIAITIGGYGWIRACRSWALSYSAALFRLSNFTVESCVCAVEADRPIVYSNIAVLMVAKGLVAEGAPQSEALAAFNELVRTKMHAAFVHAFGRTSFNYSQITVFAFLIHGTTSLDFLPYVVGLPWRDALCWITGDAFFVFTIGPAGVVMLDLCMKIHLEWRDSRSHALVLGALVALIFYSAVMVVVFAYLLPPLVVQSDVAIAAWVMLALLAPLLLRRLMQGRVSAPQAPAAALPEASQPAAPPAAVLPEWLGLPQAQITDLEVGPPAADEVTSTCSTDRFTDSVHDI